MKNKLKQYGAKTAKFVELLKHDDGVYSSERHKMGGTADFKIINLKTGAGGKVNVGIVEGQAEAIEKATAVLSAATHAFPLGEIEITTRDFGTIKSTEEVNLVAIDGISSPWPAFFAGCKGNPKIVAFRFKNVRAHHIVFDDVTDVAEAVRLNIPVASMR